MARIAGVEIPDKKRVDIGLTYLYGIGRSNVGSLIEASGLDANKRVKDLTEEEVGKILKALEKFVVEGDLRQEVNQNVRRLEEIGSYRGLRHRRGLPARGQRTRHNARTKRGKRKTVGTSKKEK
ncbi:30S ribosomal protein S13 [Patescibacteria group bacterium]|nr:30S ribosomal protein S13 [Patescibacteria group bacterium]MCL5409348.1 30S ribosomal protein S13 [Patescibacteria group bacterium]